MSNADIEHNKVADALKHSWVYHLPEWIWPYAQLARWERPIGWQLLMWPCWWSLALGWNRMLSDTASQESVFNYTVPPVSIAGFFALFLFGAFLMRGAGCTYNDLVDQDIDDKVARTRSRPLPSGRVSKKGALLFLVMQALVALLVLLQFNNTVFWLCVASLLTVAVYPFMKRVTWWPQLFLGLAFSWGALVGWWALIGLSVSNDPALWVAPVVLYIGCICWVIGYDTIYAHQDIEDDALVGVMSTARLFGEDTKWALVLLYSAALILWAVAFYAGEAGWPAWIALAGVAIHLAWQVKTLEINDPAHCLMKFKSNSRLGFYLFSGLVIAALLQRQF